MSEPGRAPKVPVVGFQTTYSKRLKSRLYNADALKKITTPTIFKSPKTLKTKLRTQFDQVTVSTEQNIPHKLTPDNTGVNCPNQRVPLAKISSERPSVDRQGVGEAA